MARGQSSDDGLGDLDLEGGGESRPPTKPAAKSVRAKPAAPAEEKRVYVKTTTGMPLWHPYLKIRIRPDEPVFVPEIDNWLECQIQTKLVVQVEM